MARPYFRFVIENTPKLVLYVDAFEVSLGALSERALLSWARNAFCCTGAILGEPSLIFLSDTHYRMVEEQGRIVPPECCMLGFPGNRCKRQMYR